MWKIILKNLWNRRKKNGWLLAELVLVSVVTWSIMDPVIVLLHDASLPLGYDVDKLCLIEIQSLDKRAPNYDKQATDSATVVDNFFRLIKKVKAYPEVEQAAPILSYTYINSPGSSTTRYCADTLTRGAHIIYFTPGHNFFETYGIKAVTESPSAEQLSKANYAGSDIIVTRNLPDYLLRGKPGLNKQFYNSNDKDTTFFRIVGVVENIRPYSEWRPSAIVFIASHRINPWDIDGANILVRLKQGITPKQFINKFQPQMGKEMKAGNLFVRSIQPYRQLLNDREYTNGTTNKIRMNMALAAFFLINLCLGVIGTFWLQTRRRAEEAGIMRSFGARPRDIVIMLLGEGFVICTLAYLLACLGYLQYAFKEGLYSGASQMLLTDSNYWVSPFTSHFIGVSLIVYLIIWTVVSIGIYIPARIISQVKPVDALRDE